MSLNNNVTTTIPCQEDNNEFPEINNWDELEISPEILRGIYGYGFEKPSPIQKKAIVPIINKKDIIAQAQSGTGKTGCFAIGTLYRIDPKVRALQAMVMAPTRELSRQISSVISSISTQIEGLKSYLLNYVCGFLSDCYSSIIWCFVVRRIFKCLLRV